MPPESFPKHIVEAFGKKVPDYQIGQLLKLWDEELAKKVGPQGPPGPPGPIGFTGEKGEPGEPAVIKWEVHPSNPRQNGKSVLDEMRGEASKGKPRRSKKKPQDHRSPKKWTDEAIDNQRDLIERAVKLLEDKVLLIQVLEVQVDDARRQNDDLLKMVKALEAKLEEHDDRINWLET